MVQFIHQGHLSGTALVTNADGTVNGTMAYYPWGGTRDGSVPTDIRFTGQRLDGTGLYYYNARYYDATIGRFISPDIIVPDPANPQSFNRYSYCLNNPLKYVDPSGQYYEEHLFAYMQLFELAQSRPQDPPGYIDFHYSDPRQQQWYEKKDALFASFDNGESQNQNNVSFTPEPTDPVWEWDSTSTATAGMLTAAIIGDDATGVGVVDDLLLIFVGVGYLGYNAYINRDYLADKFSDACDVDISWSKQDKKLSDGEIDRLKRGGVDPHDLKEGSPGQKDLYKDKNGNIIVKPKGGKGPGEPTGLNINDY